MLISNEIKVTTEILLKGALLFALIDIVFVTILTKLPANAVMNFCILGGLWGIATHIWAIYHLNLMFMIADCH